MKQHKIKVIFRILTVSVLLAANSCSNEFLQERQRTATLLKDTIYMTNFETEKSVEFDLPQAGNAHWRVYQFPSWLKIDPVEGNFSDGKSGFHLEKVDEIFYSQWGFLDLPLIIEVDGIGLVQYPFQFFNYGTPDCALSNYSIDFNYESVSPLAIHNNGGGILLWNIKDKPSWISVLKQNGIINVNSGELIHFFVSRDNLATGTYSGEITLETNSFKQDIKIQVSMKISDPVISGVAELIDGDVVDADYCKATGQLVIATKYPNRMYLYNPGQAKKTLELQKIPVNVAISENGDQIVASFSNAELSVVSPESFTILKNIPIGIITSDLALGGNGWAYLAPKVYTTNNMLSVDLNSGSIVKKVEDLNGLTILKKVPGKNLLYGSKPGWTPDFLLVFDISNGAVNEVIDQWSASLLKFWISEDGKQIFTGNKNIYKSPDFQMKGNIMESPEKLGELELVPGIIGTMEHSLARKELFFAYRDYSGESVTKILRIDDSGYYTKNTYSINNLPLEEDGFYYSVIPEIHFMFVNKSGNELNVIKLAMSSHGKEDWYYEKINL